VNGKNEPLLITATSQAGNDGKCDPQNAALQPGPDYGCETHPTGQHGWCAGSKTAGDILTIKLANGPTTVTTLELEGIYGGSFYGTINRFELYHTPQPAPIHIGSFDGPADQHCGAAKQITLPTSVYTDTLQIKVTESFSNWPSLRVGVNSKNEPLLITATSHADNDGKCDPQNAALQPGPNYGCETYPTGQHGWCASSKTTGDILTIKLANGPTTVTTLELEGIYGGSFYGTVNKFDLCYIS
jgi:hypothetical protein